MLGVRQPRRSGVVAIQQGRVMQVCRGDQFLELAADLVGFRHDELHRDAADERALDDMVGEKNTAESALAKKTL